MDSAPAAAAALLVAAAFDNYRMMRRVNEGVTYATRTAVLDVAYIICMHLYVSARRLKEGSEKAADALEDNEEAMAAMPIRKLTNF